jgi:cytosine/adenosine deaminase-related metal-dependent hydrolase
MNLTRYGLEAGCPANLVVLDHPNVTAALRFRAPPIVAMSQRRLVDAQRMRDLAKSSR